MSFPVLNLPLKETSFREYIRFPIQGILVSKVGSFILSSVDVLEDLKRSLQTLQEAEYIRPQHVQCDQVTQQSGCMQVWPEGFLHQPWLLML